MTEKEDLDTYLLSLSARITELDAHVATLRQMLDRLGVTPEEYEAVHQPIADAYQEQHRDKVADAARREIEERAQIARLLKQHQGKPQ